MSLSPFSAQFQARDSGPSCPLNRPFQQHIENRMMLTSACCKEAWHFVRRSCSINLENFKHDKNGCRKTSVVTLFPPAKAEGHQNPMFYHLGYFDCFKANLFRRFVKFYSYMQF